MGDKGLFLIISRIVKNRNIRSKDTVIRKFIFNLIIGKGEHNMKFEYVIKDSVGIHARPAGSLVKKVKEYSSKVTIIKGDKSVDGNKLMALMSLGIKCGDTITVKVEGDDEDTAGPDIKLFFEENL